MLVFDVGDEESFGSCEVTQVGRWRESDAEGAGAAAGGAGGDEDGHVGDGGGEEVGGL